MGELGPDLVGPPGDQLAFHQRKAVAAGEDPVIGLAAFGACLGGVGDEHPVFLGVLEKIPLQAAHGGLGGSFNNGEIPLVQFPVLDFLIHHPQSLRGFRRDDDAAGVPVNAVAQGGGKSVFLPGPPLPLLIEIGLDVIDKGAPVFRTVVGMHRQSRALVHQQNVFVLVDDVQLGGGHRQIGIVLPGLFKKLVVDIQLQNVTRVQPGVPVNALAVALDPLQADVFLSQGCREQGDGLGKEPVQPLSGVVGTDGKFFHSLFPTFSSKWRLICSVNSIAAL